MLFSPIAAGLAMIISAAAPMTQTLSGNYPLTVTHSQFGNGTYCLTLTQFNGRGQPPGGSASLVFGSTKLPYGSFEIINHLLVVTIQKQDGSQNAGLLFTVPVRGGDIGKGFYENVAGGDAFDMGDLVFGAKGGC
jgi:hypothetical protein